MVLWWSRRKPAAATIRSAMSVPVRIAELIVAKLR